jgi:DNA invertase Pin-like site-specific DNA recombinase
MKKTSTESLTPVAIYTRGQEGNPRSPRYQIMRCRGFAQANGFTIAAVFSDSSMASGAVVTRPGLARLLDDGWVDDGAQFRAVLVDDLARLSRNIEGLRAIIHALRPSMSTLST